jgi:hypothetical protein
VKLNQTVHLGDDAQNLQHVLQVDGQHQGLLALEDELRHLVEVGLKEKTPEV